MRKINILVLSVFSLLFSAFCFAQEDVVKIGEENMAGVFFGVPVSMDNYRFAKAAIEIFGTRWGMQPKTPQELEDRTWDDLLMSYEAYRRNIAVDSKEAEDEVAKLLESEKVSFNWKVDKAAYEKWVKERVKEPAQVFENQIKHLLQLQKLRMQIIDSLQPKVSEEEALGEYLNEYNTLSLELVEFESLDAAKSFYEKMRSSKLWDKEEKKNPKFSKKPGFVSLEFLIDMWKIPKDDAYAMLALPVYSVYKPAPIYHGFGVFRTLQKRVAEKEKFGEHKQSYFDQVKRRKQYEGFNDWFKAFKKDADVQIFIKPKQAP